MIGLSFIAQTFGVEYKGVAESIGVIPQTLQDWLKGRRRIPAPRLRQLAEMFGIPEMYFQKELDDSDKLDILIMRLGRLTTVPGNGSRSWEPVADTLPNGHPLDPYSTDAFRIWQEDALTILLARLRRLLSDGPTGNSTLHFRLLSDLTGLLEDSSVREPVLRALQIFLYICLKRRQDGVLPTEYAWCENLDSPSIHLMRLILST